MEYLERMKAIQNSILNFLDDENDQNLEDLVALFKNQKTQNDTHELKSILTLICKIIQNRHRDSFFFEKIKKILNNLKTEIKQSFSNFEIFNIFKESKRALLLLIDENLMTVDDSIAEELSKYDDYFYPEIKKINPNEGQVKELPEDFEERRRIGENDLYVCELIRNDSVEQFIINFNKNDFSLTTIIPHSIFETNSFLIDKTPTLIEYTLFFGSIQILKFLFQNNVQLESSSWIYAIHGKNPDIIHFLEDNKISPEDPTYNECLAESIKCHHNDFALYFKDNLLNKNIFDQVNTKKEKDYLRFINDEIHFGFRYYNFFFISEIIKEPLYFFYAVNYGHYEIVDYLYKNIEGLNINQLIISILALEYNNIDVFEYLLKLPEIKIGYRSLSGCSNLKQIVIPSFITTIGESSFSNCQNLSDVTIPPSVKTIEKYAFSHCTSLKVINIPSSVESIGDCSFLKCKKLKEFIVPSSVKSIGINVISQCESLETIIIPPIISFIEADKFRSFTKLKEFSIPKSVNKIPKNCFYECTSITKIEIPSSVEFIDEYAFYKCTSLVEITIPNSVKNIGQYSFASCVSLKLINLSSSLTTIENNLFEKCSSLEKLIIPSSVQLINEFSFYDCNSLKEINIPSSVKVIKFSAFNNCSSLELVLFSLPSNLITIDSYSFENCSSLKKIEIPSSVKSIRRFAFKDCKVLDDVIIDPSIKIIQPDAFNGCDSLDFSLIPSSAQNIKLPQENPPYIKMILLGASNVGKTCILHRYIDNSFQEYLITNGVDFKSKNNKIDGNNVRFQIWDTAGIERLRSITKAYYKNTSCAIIVFDLTSPESFETAISYFYEIYELNGFVPTIFLGNKCDDHQHRKEIDNIGKLAEFEKLYKTKYFEVSAKNNENIVEALNYVATEGFYQFIYDGEVLKIIDPSSNNNGVDIRNKEENQSKC